MGIINSNLRALEATGFAAKIASNEVIKLDESTSSFRSIYRGRTYPRVRLAGRHKPKSIDWVNYVEPIVNEDKFSVLVIGDEQSMQSIRITLASHLSLNFKFIEARSGNHALRLIVGEDIDLIIFGEGVLDIDGLDFLERLNRMIGKQKIPLIEMLTQEALDVGVQAMKMGAHDYVLKDSAGHYFELLPILVSRIYSEKQTLSVLHKAAGVHQTIADCTPAVIYQFSLQGGKHDVRISPQISEMGLSLDKWGGDTELHHQMCHAEDIPAVKKALELSYKTGGHFQCEYRVKTMDETFRWFRDQAKVVMDKYGRPLFLQRVMTDITRLKSQNDELVYYRGKIDELVKQKTERLDRRVTILETCNSSLSENYNKLYQQYLDLLATSQAYEVISNAA